MAAKQDRAAREARTSIRVLVATDDEACRTRLLEAVRGDRCLVVQAGSSAALAAALHAATMGMLEAPELIAVRARMLTEEVRGAIAELRQGGNQPVVVALVNARDPVAAGPLQSAHARLLEEPFDARDLRALISRLAATTPVRSAPRATLDSSV